MKMDNLDESLSEADANISSVSSLKLIINDRSDIKHYYAPQKNLSDCDLDVSNLDKKQQDETLSLGDGQKSDAGVESICITNESIHIDAKF